MKAKYGRFGSRSGQLSFVCLECCFALICVHIHCNSYSPLPLPLHLQLEEMLEEQRHSFKKQLSLLQEEIASKETQIAQITEKYRAQVRRKEEDG